MEASVQQHLHSLTLRTLHAHSFNRASSQAAHTLTDILARYLALLALTAKQHAEHSGRDGAGVNVWDVIESLSELGVGVDELEEFMTGEGREMDGYGNTVDARPPPMIAEGDVEDAGMSAAARRLDSLADIKSTVLDGLESDLPAAFSLEYHRVPSPSLNSPYSAPSSTLHSPEHTGMSSPPIAEHDRKGKGREIFLSSSPNADAMDLSTPSVQPPLVFPPSPISNPSFTPTASPSSHSHKRARWASWTPPDHVPEFLPPFPGARPEPTGSDATLAASDRNTGKPTDEKAPSRRVPLPLRPASVSKSSYTKPISYAQSTIAQRFGDLPDELSTSDTFALPPTPGASGSTNKNKDSLQPLIAAYHVLQSDSQPATNSARLRVAHLLATSAPSRYSAPDTLFASSSPPRPRFPPPLPTHAVPVPPPDGQLAPKPSQVLPLPKMGSKFISDNISAVDDPSMPWRHGNLTRFTRELLPEHLFSKVTRLNPPPVLRPPVPPNAKDAPPVEPLLYHKPIAAPWNTSVADADDLRRKDAKKHTAGRDTNAPTSKKLPDADLYATWDWVSKDPQEPLVVRRGKIEGYATASFLGRSTGGVTPGGTIAPLPTPTTLNGLRSPANANGRSFAHPRLPASALRINTITAAESSGPLNVLVSPSSTPSASTSLVIKTSSRRGSLNGIESSHSLQPIEPSHRIISR